MDCLSRLNVSSPLSSINRGTVGDLSDSAVQERKCLPSKDQIRCLS
jgi:hypothetical protein